MPQRGRGSKVAWSALAALGAAAWLVGFVGAVVLGVPAGRTAASQAWLTFVILLAGGAALAFFAAAMLLRCLREAPDAAATAVGVWSLLAMVGLGQAAVLASAAPGLRPAVPAVGIVTGVLPVFPLARSIVAAWRARRDRRRRRSPTATP